MEVVETQGASYDDAKARALEQLGVSDEALVEIEVIEEGENEGEVRLRAKLKTEAGEGSSILADSGEHMDDLGEEADAETTGKVLALIEEVIRKMDYSVEVQHHGNHGRYVQVEFVGRDSLYLTHHGGELLDAMQYLLNVLIGKQISHSVRVVLDAQNYRKRRAENLRNLAVSLAYQVRDRQQEAELDPLPAHERRIIHRALVNDDSVYTYSEGEEPHRFVVISPRKKS